jgi:NodT family efflux transporter outer membrane factor (OMF) lipoprotein
MSRLPIPASTNLNRSVRRTGLLLSISIALSACAVGPDYHKPAVLVPAQFEYVDGWKSAAPADTAHRGEWWSLYNDPVLDELIARLDISNQNLASAEAQYRQARALVRSARASFYPTISVDGGVTRSGRGGGSTGVISGQSGSVSTFRSSGISEDYQATLGASWELDVWGRLRRTLEGNRADAQASLADLAAARLSYQSELVQNYLQLRVMDEQRRLLDATVAAYQRSLTLTQNQYNAGIVPRSDVTQAQTQLKSTQAQSIDLQWQRAQLENAIAVLVGVPPSSFNLEELTSIPGLPEIPVALPSQLLERRPDIASAERSVLAANARIGVAKAAYYPNLTLSANGGYTNSSFSNLFSVPNRFWSLGPSLALALFDGGARRSEVERSEAVYDQTVAQYRQSVLTGFREVEDYLVQLSTLEREAQVQQEALDAARESQRLIENQYRAGTIDFNDVVNVQATTLSNERSALTLLGSRLTASVQLIAALGGGWTQQDLKDADPR